LKNKEDSGKPTSTKPITVFGKPLAQFLRNQTYYILAHWFVITGADLQNLYE